MHPDNKMTGLLAAHALKEYNGCLTLYSYDVWGGLFPNVMVEITNVMEQKIAALRVRRSPAKLVDGERRIRKANAFGPSGRAVLRAILETGAARIHDHVRTVRGLWKSMTGTACGSWGGGCKLSIDSDTTGSETPTLVTWPWGRIRTPSQTKPCVPGRSGPC